MIIGMNCHDKVTIINWPIDGATTGTKINIVLTKDINFANSLPEYKSRAIALETTTVAPAPTP